jgi:L-galactose dehydrogenase
MLMQRRLLGQTGMSVSVIGFGASSLGNVFGEVGVAAGERAVSAAVDAGINLFDVSPFYGLTLAEERLGAALQGRRERVILATKCGRYGVNDFDFSARTITEGLEASLRRLRTDYVDVLQAHDIEFAETSRILGEAIPAMERLREQGKVRAIGVTGYWPAMLAHVASAAKLDCVLNYCHANLFVDDMLHALLPVAAKTGLGLLNASPLHMGLLGDRPIPDWHPAPPGVRAAADEVRRICARHRVNPGTLALRICLDLEPVASTFVGISSEAEVEAACASLDWVAPPALLEQVRAAIAPVHNAVWPSGLPGASEVPVAAR